MIGVQVMIQVGLLCQSGRCLDNSRLKLTLVERLLYNRCFFNFSKLRHPTCHKCMVVDIHILHI